MAEVIDLDARRAHYSGPACCTKCDREWVAVAPLGTDALECPSCGKMAGVKFSAREVRLIRTLEKVATGRALGENSRINWDIARDVAREALRAEGWGTV